MVLFLGSPLRDIVKPTQVPSSRYLCPPSPNTMLFVILENLSRHLFFLGGVCRSLSVCPPDLHTPTCGGSCPVATCSHLSFPSGRWAPVRGPEEMYIFVSASLVRRMAPGRDWVLSKCLCSLMNAQGTAFHINTISVIPSHYLLWGSKSTLSYKGPETGPGLPSAFSCIQRTPLLPASSSARGELRAPHLLPGSQNVAQAPLLDTDPHLDVMGWLTVPEDELF